MTGARGFTLAELLVAIAMLGFILAGVITLQRQGQFTYLVGAARVEAQQNARVAMTRVLRELRTARAVTAASSCNTGTSSLTFTDQDGDTVQYSLSSDRLERRFNGGQAEVVISGVESVQFLCYRADGTTATATPADVRSVVVTLQVKPEDTSGAYGASAQRALAQSRVRLRNLL